LNFTGSAEKTTSFMFNAYQALDFAIAWIGQQEECEPMQLLQVKQNLLLCCEGTCFGNKAENYPWFHEVNM
jgi:hypothetical protein